MAKHIVLYFAALCGDCQKLKSFMDAHGVVYEVRDIKENPGHGQELEEKTGKLGVPYLIIDGNWKRGYVPGEPFTDDFARELLGIT